MARSTNHQSGFTLVELLVVISVIAVLLALLLPSLSKARAAARTLLCQTQLRQQHLGLWQYAQDNTQAFPLTGRHTSQWVTRIAPYLNSGDTADYADPTNNVVTKIKLMACPETKLWVKWSTGYCYGINQLITNGRSDLPTPSYSTRRKLSTIKTSASKIMLIGDNWDYTPIDWGHFDTAAKEMGDVGYPYTNASHSKNHDRSINYVFVDGHTINARPGQYADLQFIDDTTSSIGW